ncbi:HAD-IA family hydrolase [Nocardioides sp.]|uniref:HAD family hydrolase n=1 Tax=Nocardioides sp. TaxID=35761 RepID=UPI001A248132|nr:HAD-IA family hydrolase [Nocardioides sp.]MBJ7359871.1 HAD-IA family hydrolase [Nocardioides sp.]
MGVRHVLLDADGVLQRHPGGFVDVARRLLGGTTDERLVAAFEAEAPYLTSGGDFPAALGERLRTFGVRTPLLELHRQVWLTIEVDPVVVDLVRGLRSAGHAVHLATNQHQHRAAYMRDELGYDELFDSCWYSCEVGAAKPSPDYFTAVLAGLGATAGECLLVDDSRPNIDTARGLGMEAEQWTTRDGHEALRKALARHGLLGAE